MGIGIGGSFRKTELRLRDRRMLSNANHSAWNQPARSSRNLAPRRSRWRSRKRSIKTMQLLILHLIGDYILQSDWMATNKTSSSVPCLVHATVYSLPFLLLTRSPIALFVIWSTHFAIDRWRLAKYVIWLKNLMRQPLMLQDVDPFSQNARQIRFRESWENCKATGYPSDVPVWLATWLMIIADNTLHLICNYLAVRYL